MNPSLDRRALLGAAGVAVAGWALLRPAPAAAGPFAVQKTPAQWRAQLGAARFNILREAGTEVAGTSPLNSEHRRGTFTCAGCNLPLFASTTKFDSGTGWPSFYRALPNAVITRTDRTLGISRTEVLCRRCGGHLGHVFDDGPKPTGLRYCMNGLALQFRAGAVA